MSITTTIPAVTAYGGTIPNRAAGQTEEQFAANVYPFLLFYNANFITDTLAYSTAMNNFKTEANALETNVNAKEASAVAAAAAALLTANVTVWVSGTTYAIGNNVLSPIDFKTYVRKTNGAGTTDPSADSANYDLKTAPDTTKLPLTGGTMTGALNTAVVDKGTVSSGTVTFTQSAGNVQRLQVGGTLTIATGGWATSGMFGDLLIRLVNGGSATVTLPTVNWVQPNGTVTTTFATYLTAIKRTGFQTSGTDFMYLWSTDAGTTIYGKLV